MPQHALNKRQGVDHVVTVVVQRVQHRLTYNRAGAEVYDCIESCGAQNFFQRFRITDVAFVERYVPYCLPVPS